MSDNKTSGENADPGNDHSTVRVTRVNGSIDIEFLENLVRLGQEQQGIGFGSNAEAEVRASEPDKKAIPA
ncbi:MAG: hypothetical protein HY301_15645 [Verrucomicrobia bacterium]|nr:hypothetical protein [Verrucomicrobiota bacterium]